MREELLKKLREELLEKVFDEIYSGGNEEGKKLVADKEHHGFLQVLVKHANRKLTALRWYPPFNSRIEQLRLSYSIDSPNTDDSTRDDLGFYRACYDWLFGFKDVFYDTLTQRLGNYITDRASYVSIVYYVLFDREVPSAKLVDLVIPPPDPDPSRKMEWLSPEPVEGVDLELILGRPDETYRNPLLEAIRRQQRLFSSLAEDEDFLKSVWTCRDDLEISSTSSVEDIADNYHRYYAYLDRYSHYSARSIPFFRDIYSLMNDYEFLNTDSDLDYALIYAHVVRGMHEIGLDDLVDLRGSGGPQFVTSKELASKSGENQGRLYMEIPVYANKGYLILTQGLVLAKSRSHYKVSDSTQIPKSYYRGKFASEIYDSAKSEPVVKQLELVSSRLVEVYGKSLRNLINIDHRTKEQQEIDKKSGEDLKWDTEDQDKLHDWITEWTKVYREAEKDYFSDGYRLR